jgi:uroporphyrinogen-III decarboxylase
MLSWLILRTWAVLCAQTHVYQQGLDETADPTLIRPLLKGRVALQGNLDPATMHASDEVGAFALARHLPSVVELKKCVWLSPLSHTRLAA